MLLQNNKYIINFNNNRDITHALRPQCNFEWPWVTFSDLAKFQRIWNVARHFCDSWASCWDSIRRGMDTNAQTVFRIDEYKHFHLDSPLSSVSGVNISYALINLFKGTIRRRCRHSKCWCQIITSIHYNRPTSIPLWCYSVRVATKSLKYWFVNLIFVSCEHQVHKIVIYPATTVSILSKNR